MPAARRRLCCQLPCTESRNCRNVALSLRLTCARRHAIAAAPGGSVPSRRWAASSNCRCGATAGGLAGGLVRADADVRRGWLVSHLRRAATLADRQPGAPAQELQGPWRLGAVLAIRRDLHGPRVAETVAGRFDVELRDVDWHASAPGEAMQIVVPSVGDAWFDHDELAERAVRVHGAPGARCAECQTWRCYPLGFDPVPPLTDEVLPPLLDPPSCCPMTSPQVPSGSATAAARFGSSCFDANWLNCSPARARATSRSSSRQRDVSAGRRYRPPAAPAARRTSWYSP